MWVSNLLPSQERLCRLQFLIPGRVKQAELAEVPDHCGLQFKLEVNLDNLGIMSKSKSMWEYSSVVEYSPGMCRTPPSLPNYLDSVEPQRSQFPSGESECSSGQWGTVTPGWHCAGTAAREE